MTTWIHLSSRWWNQVQEDDQAFLQRKYSVYTIHVGKNAHMHQNNYKTQKLSSVNWTTDGSNWNIPRGSSYMLGMKQYGSMPYCVLHLGVLQYIAILEYLIGFW